MSTISIILPAYNQGQFLAESIQSALDQSYHDIELIIVNDGSTDNSEAVVKGFSDPRIHYIYQENGGLSGARNTALRHATGEFVTFLDSDDCFFPDKLAVLHNYLEAHPEIGMVSGNIQKIDSNSQPFGSKMVAPTELDLATFLHSNPLPVGGILLRRTWLDRVEDFDESLRACEDWDIWIQLAHAGCQFAWVEHPVLLYRVHGEQMTQDPERMRTAGLTVLDKFFSQPNLPADVLAMQETAKAAILVKAVGRAYHIGRFEEANQDLEEAIRLDSTLIEGDPSKLVEQLIGWSQAIDSSDPETFLKSVYTHLPASLVGIRGEVRRAMAKVILAPLFQKGPQKRWRTRRTALLRSVWYDPSWLRNRGVLRMLVDAWLPLRYQI